MVQHIFSGRLLFFRCFGVCIGYTESVYFILCIMQTHHLEILLDPILYDVVDVHYEFLKLPQTSVYMRLVCVYVHRCPRQHDHAGAEFVLHISARWGQRRVFVCVCVCVNRNGEGKIRIGWWDMA
jgi:hypothetical protein